VGWISAGPLPGREAAGSVTITLPDAGSHFMSLMVVSQDHNVPKVVYGGCATTFTRQEIGTRYMTAAIRTLVDPANAEDVKQAHALQDAIKVSVSNLGKFELPSWD
jgi:hypothetical protein